MTAASCATCGGRAGGPTSLPQSVSGQTTSCRGTTRPANAGGSDTSSCECIAGPLMLLAGHLCHPGIWVDSEEAHLDPCRNWQQVQHWLVLNEREKLTWLASASPLTNMPMPKRTTCRQGIGVFWGAFSESAGRGEGGGFCQQGCRNVHFSEAWSGLEGPGLRQKVQVMVGKDARKACQGDGGDVVWKQPHLHFAKLAPGTTRFSFVG